MEIQCNCSQDGGPTFDECSYKGVRLDVEQRKRRRGELNVLRMPMIKLRANSSIGSPNDDKTKVYFRIIRCSIYPPYSGDCRKVNQRHKRERHDREAEERHER